MDDLRTMSQLADEFGSPAVVGVFAKTHLEWFPIEIDGEGRCVIGYRRSAFVHALEMNALWRLGAADVTLAGYSLG